MNLIERRPEIIKFTSLLVLSVAFQYVAAQPGSLDSGFNSTGILVTNDTGVITTQTDGKLIIGDGGILTRYKLNGTPDSSFGINGSVTTDFGTEEEGIFSLVQETNGKIVVKGRSGGNLLLAQYLPDGSLDSSYFEKGKLKLDPLPVNTVFVDLAKQEDGKIVVSGKVYDSSRYLYTHFFVTRFKSDGSIDNSFGINGAVYTNFLEPVETMAMAIQKDGKIVLIGNVHTLDFAGYLLDSLAMARYNTDGSLDTGFNNTGKLTMILHDNPSDTEHGAEGRAILLQPDGKIVVGVHDLYQHSHGFWVRGDFALVRFKTNGVLDDTFNGTGIKIIPALWGRPFEFKIAYQGDGKILMAVSEAIWEFFQQAQIELARVNNNGSTDSSFGLNGTILIPNNTSRTFGSLYKMSLGYRRIYLSGTQGEAPPEYRAEVFALKNDGIPLNPTGRHFCSTPANINIISDMEGATYQWQVSTDGETFIDLSNTNYYSGATTATLSLNNIPFSFNGYEYRCIAGISFSNVTTIHFLNENENEWLGTVSNEWENPGNWLCGGVPGNNTTVIINSGNVVIHSNVSIANLRLQPGATLTVSNGYTLAVTSQ